MDVLVRQDRAGDIPVLELAPQGVASAGARLPLAILYHGYTGRKEFILAQGYHLAMNGFVVVMPDAWGHGDRASGGISDFLEAATRSAAEIDGIIDAWTGRAGVDTARVGLAGFSMGGCITFEYLSRGAARVKAAAPMIGSPDWASILESSAVEPQLAGMGVPGDAAGRAAYVGLARSLEPAGRLPRFSTVPLLVQVGAMDTVVPPAPVRAFCDRLRPRYPDPALLRFVEHPGVGHADNVAMNQAVVAWFRQHLGEPVR